MHPWLMSLREDILQARRLADTCMGAPDELMVIPGQYIEVDEKDIWLRWTSRVPMANPMFARLNDNIRSFRYRA